MVQLSSFDVVLIVLFFAITLFIGIYVSKQSGKSAAEYFLSGRNMPWWLLGVSMVATTFSTDTPNLVTDIVRTNGVSGNWVWWAFLLTGLFNCFCLCQALEKIGSQYRYRVLRIALWWCSCSVFKRVSSHLFRDHLQYSCHVCRNLGSYKNRCHHVGFATLGNGYLCWNHNRCF